MPHYDLYYGNHNKKNNPLNLVTFPVTDMSLHQKVLKAMINSDIRVNQHQPVDQRDTHH